MRCFYCDKEISTTKNSDGRVQETRYIMVALDRPYGNLFFHRPCFDSMDNMEVYLTQNMDDVLKSIENNKKSKKMGKNG